LSNSDRELCKIQKLIGLFNTFLDFKPMDYIELFENRSVREENEGALTTARAREFWIC